MPKLTHQPKETNRDHPTPPRRSSRTTHKPASTTWTRPQARFRRALIDPRATLIAQLASIDGTAYVSHRLAGDEHVMLAQLDAIRRAIAATEAALRRLDNGTFGFCEGCGQVIPDERLEVLPHANRCVRCQQLCDSRDRRVG